MEDFIERMFMNKVKEGIVRDFKSLDDDMKNSEFERIFRERSDLFEKNKQYKQQIDDLVKWLENEISKCLEDNISNKAKPNVKYWRLYDLREFLSKLKEKDVE